LRKLLFVLFLFSTCITLFPTQAKIDSLEAQLNKSSNKEKAQILNALAAEYSPSVPQKAIEYAEEALKLAEQFHNKREETNSYKNLADSYYYLNQIPKSLEMYQKTAELEKQISGEFSENYVDRLGDVAWCLEYLVKFEEALEIYEEALAIAKKMEYYPGIIDISSNIGSIYYKTAKYDKALKMFNNVLETEKKHNLIENISTSYNNIGMIYDAWKQHEKAIEYYKTALEIDREKNNEYSVAIRLNNIGYAYRSLKENEKALKYLQEALDIEQKYGRNEKIAIRLSNLGLIYITTGQYDKALKNYLEAQTILESSTHKNYLSTLYNHIAHVYIQQKKYKKAEDFLDRSQKIAEENDLKQQQVHNYLEYAYLYKQTGNYREAFQNQVAYSNLKDSIFSEEKHKQFAEFETKYETEKKEKEIELLTKNSEIQNLILRKNRIVKYSFIIGFVLLLILAFIVYNAYKSEREEIKKRKIAEKELHELNQNLEKRVDTEVTKRREQEQKAVEQSRLAALGELAAGIAHEINQPLHSIAFSIDNMMLAIDEDDADKEYLQNKTKNIFADVDRMKHIIDHIRIFSRKQSEDENEPFNINTSIVNAVNMIKEQYQNHRISLSLDLAENLPEISGNLYRFEQVVLILLSNGKDAIETKAESTEVDYQKQLTLKTFQENDNITMEFEDNGTGIPKAILEKVFNPFFTTKKPGQGTGLGLSIAIGIIEKMGGSIKVESEVGKGTKVIVKIGTRMQE